MHIRLRIKLKVLNHDRRSHEKNSMKCRQHRFRWMKKSSLKSWFSSSTNISCPFLPLLCSQPITFLALSLFLFGFNKQYRDYEPMSSTSQSSGLVKLVLNYLIFCFQRKRISLKWFDILCYQLSRKIILFTFCSLYIFDIDLHVWDTDFAVESSFPFVLILSLHIRIWKS